MPNKLHVTVSGLQSSSCVAHGLRRGLKFAAHRRLRISTPHFLFFSAEEKRKRAVDGPKEKKTLIRSGGKLPLGGTETRSPSLI
jgi:hypothetical protein